MTLKRLADELHVTPMTIYRRLAKHGHNISEYRDQETGEITSEGVHYIADLFSTTTSTADATDVTEGVTHDGTSTQPGNIMDISIRLAAAEARVDGLLALVEQLQGERDTLRAALAAEQADRAAERRMITGAVEGSEGGEDHQRRGLFSWFRRR